MPCPNTKNRQKKTRSKTQTKGGIARLAPVEFVVSWPSADIAGAGNPNEVGIFASFYKLQKFLSLFMVYNCVVLFLSV